MGPSGAKHGGAWHARINLAFLYITLVSSQPEQLDLLALVLPWETLYHTLPTEIAAIAADLMLFPQSALNRWKWRPP
jgi:hypothetical protein